MDERRRALFRTLRAGTVGAARLDGAAQHGRLAGTAFVGGLLTAALDPSEMSDLTIALYGLAPSHPGIGSLRAWELDWYASSLPAAPATVLVTAAGTGREVAGLRRLGYSVDAFEPAAGQAGRIESATGSIVVPASYDDFVRASLGGESNAATPLASRRYDAVILGWGSFTHVLEPDSQQAVIAACDRLCPEGPLLVSFWAATQESRRGRAFVAGRRLGECLARLRGTAGPEGDPKQTDALGFAFNVGFTRRFSRADIESLAGGVGRRLTMLALEPYGHATLATSG